jgi:hypothetical protein
MSNGLYRSATAVARATDTRRVIIQEVNLAQNFISCQGADGQKMILNVDFQHPIVAIPVSGEFWIIQRTDNQWRLDRRMETGSETTNIADLQPGDRRIDSSGDLYLNAAKTKITADMEIDGDADFLGDISVDGTITLSGLDLLTLIQQAVPAGVTVPFAGSAAPAGWELADGGTLNAIANPVYMPLYNNIGTLHGGTGPNNFKKPDIQGRMVIGHGTHVDVSTIGANEGASLINRTMKHYHVKGTLAVSASGAHGHSFSGNAATITGGAHGHTFTGTGGTTGTESQGHVHYLGSGSGSVGGFTANSAISGGAHVHTINVQSGGIGLTTGGTPYTMFPTDSPVPNVSSNSNTHTHPASEFSGNSSGAHQTHTHSFTPAGTLSNTDTHTHSYTPAGTLSNTDTHIHNNADFTGFVGTTTGIAETSAYIVLPHIIKL